MKVIHLVLSDSFAGIEQHVDELLSNNSIGDSILICNESISENFNNNITIYKIKNISRHSLYGKYKLNKLLKKINPDIVHTHGSKTSSIITSINKNKYKHVATVHGIKKNKKIYEKADFVIGVSQKSIEGINNNSKVISNWWYPKLTKFNTSKNDYALAVGRLEKVKGFDLLISSWVNIKSNLIIVGSGKEKQKLIDLINKLNLNKKIKIIENVKRNDLVNYYRNASVLIVPSRDEGGPRVALEALHLEVPVLSTNVGHMDSILPQELLAKKNDQESLQKLLETYVDDIGLLNQDTIFEFITEEFSVQDKVLQTHEVYESLINNR
jgi:glycosyltransferase involved in cell wall biosynthesis